MSIKIAPQTLDADEITFTELLSRIEREGVRTVIVTGRFARTVPQQVGILALVAREVRVLTNNGREVRVLTNNGRDLTSDPSREVALRYGHFEKARQVHITLSALRAKGARRKKLQGAWREMSAAIRQCQPDARARHLNDLSVT